MKVAIVHYHLKPGGVTRVVENTVDILQECGIDSVVICGEQPPEGAFRHDNVRVVPGLGYDDELRDDATVADLKQRMETAATQALGSTPDLWHVHNHSLGKNLSLPRIIGQWAHEGKRLLLQPHDFAEDGRPQNYRKLMLKLSLKERARLDSFLYPVGPTVRYAFLNGRDRGNMAGAGLPESLSYWMPNPLWLRDDEPIDPLPELQEKKLFLYPTRSIRRKNLGELLLWAAATPGNDSLFGCTLAPANPEARPIYDAWVALAKRLDLPMRFELGTQYGFQELIASSHAITTTSIAEGFGLAFLEPYLMQKPLVGRDLPDISRDFKDVGIRLESLYPSLQIPIGWLGLDQLRRHIHEGLVKNYQGYRQSFQKPMVDEAIDAISQGDCVDFGYLDEELQQSVIEKVASSEQARLELSPEKIDVPQAPEILLQNRERITESFGKEAFKQRITTAYNELTEAPAAPVEMLSSEAVVMQFLEPRRFNLLRT